MTQDAICPTPMWTGADVFGFFFLSKAVSDHQPVSCSPHLSDQA